MSQERFHKIRFHETLSFHKHASVNTFPEDCTKLGPDLTNFVALSCTRFTHAKIEELETYLILITETSSGRRTYLKQKDGIMFIWNKSM